MKPNMEELGGRLTALSPAQRRRIWFIEYNLYWYSEIRRADLAEAFLVSDGTTRKDFTTYRGFLRRPLVEVQGRGYEAPEDFEPVFYRPNSERFLFALAGTEGIAAPYAQTMKRSDDDFSAEEVAHDLVQRRRKARLVCEAPPELERYTINPNHLRAVVRAIRHKEEMLVSYKSPNRPLAEDIWIAPHALTNDSFRWAARGWRSDYSRFGDIVLDRLQAVHDKRPSTHSIAQDAEWSTFCEIALAPNPGLDRDARRQIERQFGMENGQLRVKMRQCFLVYFLKRYQIEEKSALKAPHQEPLVVENREAVTALIPPWMRIPLLNETSMKP